MKPGDNELGMEKDRRPMEKKKAGSIPGLAEQGSNTCQKAQEHCMKPLPAVWRGCSIFPREWGWGGGERGRGARQRGKAQAGTTAFPAPTLQFLDLRSPGIQFVFL